MNPSTGRVGRPPGPHGDTLGKILPTALRLFIDEGGAALTPTRLHRETGVGRATIYRNWPEPADLIEIMLFHATEQGSLDRFVGDLRRDLYVALDELLYRFEHRPARAFFAACLEYGRHSARVASAAQAFIDGILGSFRVALDAAIASGELDGEADDLLSELAGPIVFEHVVMGREVTRRRGRQIIDDFLEHRTA